MSRSFLEVSPRFAYIPLNRMGILTIIVVLVVAAVFLVIKKRRSATRPADIFNDLRDTILRGDRRKLGVPEPVTPTTPWGLLMEWGTAGAVATVVALADGSASIYFSGGGGHIGGEGKEPIRKAAQRAVSVAAEFQPKMQFTTDFPLPRQGEVIFYVLTESGIFTATVLEEDLTNNRTAFMPLGNAAQDVITQYRLDSEQKSSSG